MRAGKIVSQLINNVPVPQTILTQKEAQRLMDAPDLKSPVGYRDKALLEVLYSTGIRTGELLRLKVSDFDPKNRTLFVSEGKGGKDRVLPLPMIAAGYLKEYVERVRPKFAKALKKDKGVLFLNYTGSPLTRCRMLDLFRRTTKAAGIDKRVTAMILRHSIASAFVRERHGHTLYSGIPWAREIIDDANLLKSYLDRTAKDV